MKHIAILLTFFPLVAFTVAGVLEWRSTKTAAERFVRILPTVFGISAFVLFFNPQVFFQVTPEGSMTLSRIMTMFSAIVACSGVFIAYSRRSSSIWMACGGLVLAFIWMFNRIVV